MGKMPFTGRTAVRILASITAAPITSERLRSMNAALPDDCIDFIVGLLQADPARRLPVEHLLNHPFLKNTKPVTVAIAMSE